MTMRILSIATLILGLAASSEAGFNVSTFEDSGLTKANSYFNATPNLTDPTYTTTTTLKGQFVSGGNSFSNTYQYVVNQTYGNYDSWSGWSISNQTNIAYIDQKTTPDYGFEYTSVTGSGAPDLATGKTSATYAVANTEGNGVPATSIVNLAPGSSPVSFQYTNTAYDYFAIKYGDGFASAFTKGNYLSLSIYGYTGQDGTGTLIGGKPITVYLADYRELNGSPDTLVTDWQFQDLSSLQGAQSLVFGTDSNDFNAFGEALPFEFALDNLKTASPAVVPEPSSLLLCLSGIGIGSLVLRRVRSRKGLLLK